MGKSFMKVRRIIKLSSQDGLSLTLVKPLGADRVPGMADMQLRRFCIFL